MFQIGHDNFHLDFNIRKNGICFSNISHKFCSYTTNTENQSADIKLSLPAGKKITLYWGDGTSTVVTGEVTPTTYSHTYTDVKTYNLTISGDYNDITYLKFDSDGSYGGDIKYMPLNLESIICINDNTFYGNVSDFNRNLTYIRILGNYCIIEGNIIDFPPNLTYFYVMGIGIITGDIKDLPSGLTVIWLNYKSTEYGNLATLSDNLYFVYFNGKTTISEYTGKTWTTNLNTFRSRPTEGGGLSSAEMDQLIIDLDEDLDWSGGGQIVLSGTNAPRTSASDDAVDSITAAGGTVITNN